MQSPSLVNGIKSMPVGSKCVCPAEKRVMAIGVRVTTYAAVCVAFRDDRSTTGCPYTAIANVNLIQPEMDPCECVHMFKAQVLIGQILQLVRDDAVCVAS